MPRWHQGYVFDVEYTGGFMREMTPAWQHFAALLLGHRAPDPSGRLRVADLGCGHAVTAAVIAATSPDAEVWGFDFNPLHVDSGRRLASAAGLANLHVEERTFADLAEAPPGTWPAFDIVSLHGVWSWIAPESRRHITTFLDRFLRPGGLVYVSYNTLAGWACMLPVQRLMHWMAKSEAGRSDEAVQSVLQAVASLSAGEAAYFVQNPMAGARLDPTGTADSRYLAHEYLNAHWDPTAMADVAAELARAKCIFLGSATLADNLPEASVPAALVPVVNAVRDPLVREMLSDLASARAFRRDIYHRGAGRLPHAEAQAMTERTAIAGLGQLPGEDLVLECGRGQLNARRDICDPLLERLLEGPLTVGAARDIPVLRGAPVADVLQVFALLVSTGRALPVLGPPSDGAAARRFNAAVAGLNAIGGELPWLASPLAGTALPADVLETLIVGEMLAGRGADAAALTACVFSQLQRSGRSMQRDGQVVADEAAARGLVGETVAAMQAQRGSLFRQLGILDN
jgi:SAM-dependent methyltransferase